MTGNAAEPRHTAKTSDAAVLWIPDDALAPPPLVKAKVTQALTLLDSGQAELATRIVADAQALAPEHPWVVFAVAYIAHKTGDATAAAHGYATVLESAPNALEVRYNLALTYMDQAMSQTDWAQGMPLFRHAVESFEAVTNAVPDLPEPYFYMGYILSVVGQHQAAATSLLKRVALVPDDAASWQRLGVCYQHLEQFRDALKAFERAHELQPDSHEIAEQIYAVVERLYQHDDLDMPLDFFIGIMERSTDPPANLQKCYLLKLIDENHFDQAKPICASLLAQHPDDSELQCIEVELMAYAGRNEEAVALCETIVKKNQAAFSAPPLAQACHEHALKALDDGDIKRAIDLAITSVRIDAQSPGAYAAYGHALRAKGLHLSAATQFHRAALLNPDEADFPAQRHAALNAAKANRPLLGKGPLSVSPVSGRPILTMLLPTRQRPDLLERFLSTAIATAADPERVEILIYVDDDDPELEAYRAVIDAENSRAGPDGLRLRFLIEPPADFRFTWDYLADIAEGDVFIFSNDDQEYISEGWDRALEAEILKYPDNIYLMWFEDQRVAPLCDFPIISRHWYEAIGFLVSPFMSYDARVAPLTHAAEALNRAHFLAHIITKHYHFTNDAELMDQTYERLRDTFNMDADHILYERHKDVWLRLDTAMLKAALEEPET